MKETLGQIIKRCQSQMTIKTLRASFSAMRVLPRWCVQSVIGFLFSIAYLGITRLKKICQKNLQHVYGTSKSSDEYQYMVKKCFKNIGQCMMDMLYFVERPKELLEIVSVKGEEHLQNALRLGKGVIAVTAHLGNFPLMFLSLVRKGYKVNVIIRPMRDKDFSSFMYDLCARWGIRMIPTSPSKEFIKKSLGALRRNELLFILLDEAATKESGVMVDFLNSRVARSVGPMLFYDRTQAPIVPIFITKENDHFYIFIEQALDVEQKLGKEENKEKNISQLTRTIESFIKKYPLQWGGWLNKRWLLDN